MDEYAGGVQECRVGHRADLRQAGPPALPPGRQSRDGRIFKAKNQKQPLCGLCVLRGEPVSVTYFSLRTRFMTTGHRFRQLKHWAESSLE
jgi:hypothetical protein